MLYKALCLCGHCRFDYSCKDQVLTIFMLERTKMFRLLMVAMLSVAFGGALGSGIWCRGGCYTHGYCYRHGETWEDECSTKICRQYNSDYALSEIIGTKCKDIYGQCKNHGDMMTVNVNGYAAECRCSVNYNTWSYTQCGISSDPKPQSGSCDCNSRSGCRSFGEKWKHNCFTMECKRNGNGWKIDPVGAECEDAYGNCIQSGQLMTKMVNGRTYHNCRCTASGVRSGYSC